MTILQASELSIGDYHNSDWVSHTGLRDFGELGPAGYYHRHVRRTNTRTRTGAMMGGQNLEDYLMGWRPEIVPDELPDDRGTVKPRKADSVVVKRFMDENPGYVTRGVAEEYQRQLDAVMANSTARALLEEMAPQVTFRAPWLGIPEGIQSRPDFLTVDGWMGDVILDLKRTDSLDVFRRNVHRLGHNTQAGMMRLTAKANGLLPAHYWLVVETSYPTRVQLFRASEATLATGELWCSQRLGELAEHYASDHWPSTINDVEELDAPVYGVELEQVA